MSIVALNSALTGLKAAQRALDTISSNISNAQVEGYTRKILPQETLLIGGIGAGVQLNSLVRNVDRFLVRDINKQASISESRSVQQAYLSQIQDFHGSSDGTRSISYMFGELGKTFSDLSSSPDSTILLNKALLQAQQTADKFNEFSKMMNNLRSQTEEEIADSVRSANQLIEQIVTLNERINRESATGRSFADLEDARDIAIRELSKYIEISTFPSENGKLVVTTKQGQTLADEVVHPLVFSQSQVAQALYYPGGGLNGIEIQNGASTIAIPTGEVGGKIGGLFTLRDQTIPNYQTQLDEMAQKMAERFDSVGLRLFTDVNGLVPASVAPPAPITYQGFAGEIRVNAAITLDATLIRRGTTGATILPGSNEIISKVSEYALGRYAYQQSTGTANISAGTIFTASGMTQTNRVVGNIDLTDYTPDLSAAPNLTLPASFDLTVNATTYTININPGDTATTLVNTINTTVGSSVAALNGLGQLTLSATTNITLANNTIGAAGMADLGFTFGTTVAQNPSFSVQVGGQSPVTVTVTPATTAANLLTTLNAIPGLTASLNGSGQLEVRPTNGGSITLLNVTGTPLTALGMNTTNVSHTAFRTTLMGADGTINTNLAGNATLSDYVRAMVSNQSEEAAAADSASEKESAFLLTLETRKRNQSGVDIDQELSELIRVQTAYAASGRMVSATERLFDELFNAFFR